MTWNHQDNIVQIICTKKSKEASLHAMYALTGRASGLDASDWSVLHLDTLWTGGWVQRRG